MTLLALFAELLRRHTHHEDLVVGTTIANRNHKEVEGLIGFFINTLALRLDLAGDLTFGNLGLELLRPGGKAMPAMDDVDRHEADIVPVGGVFRTWIAKPCDDQHVVTRR